MKKSITKGKSRRLKNPAPEHCVTKKKLKWVDMEITKIPLNPEQAVLSCCEVISRSMQYIPDGTQCTGSCTVNNSNQTPSS